MTLSLGAALALWLPLALALVSLLLELPPPELVGGAQAEMRPGSASARAAVATSRAKRAGLEEVLILTIMGVNQTRFHSVKHISRTVTEPLPGL